MNIHLQRRLKIIARQRLATLLLSGSFAITTFESALADVPHILLHSLFDPGTNAQAGALQGYSVAVVGSIAVAGAPGIPVVEDRQAENSGVVKVYDATTGGLLHTLKNPSSPAPYNPSWEAGVDDKFGYSVAVDGTRVVVGVPHENVETTFPGYYHADAGTAYVYDLASGTPNVPVAKMNNPNPAAAAEVFGYSVAVSDTRVLVGAPHADSPALEAGSAYLYDLASATPAAPVAVLNDPSPAAGDHAGNSVAISGTRVVVGAHADDTGAQDAGSAYVYDLASATPAVPVVTLNNPSPEESEGGNRFGGSVAVSGPLVAIGTPFDGANVGKAYAYNFGSATPSVPVAALTNPSPAVADWFGWSVSVSGKWVVVGAPQDDTGGSDAGIAYIYDFASAMPTAPVTTLNNPNPAVSGSFGRSIAISGTRLVVGAPNDNAATDGGIAYVYELVSATPTLPVATLGNPSLEGYDRFGLSVAVDGTTIIVGDPFDNTTAPDRGATYVFGPSQPQTLVRPNAQHSHRRGPHRPVL